jgi:ferritin-like metal-binding protein YciE
MNVGDLRTMYVAELQELRSVEDQLVAALPKMAQLVEHPQLRQALERHLAETDSQRDRLDELLKRHNATATVHEDSSMRAIIREADRWAGMVSDADCRDAGIIASAQRVEHYEIAVYGTLATWAKQLGLTEDHRVLRTILAEEKRTDATLTRLAEGGVNREAAVDAEREDEGYMAKSREVLGEAGSYVRSSARPVTHTIEDFPVAAVVLAGAAGYLMAYLAYARGTDRSRQRAPEYARDTGYSGRARAF